MLVTRLVSNLGGFKRLLARVAARGERARATALQLCALTRHAALQHVRRCSEPRNHACNDCLAIVLHAFSGCLALVLQHNAAWRSDATPRAPTREALQCAQITTAMYVYMYTALVMHQYVTQMGGESFICANRRCDRQMLDTADTVSAKLQI